MEGGNGNKKGHCHPPFILPAGLIPCHSSGGALWETFNELLMFP